VEELEGRLVPSTSTNWSGYAVSAAAGSVTDVKGTWVVPSVVGTGTAYSSTWVGIDGYASNTVEQIGTDSDLINGVPTYYAWYEMYPHPSNTITLMAVQPGDTITAEVSYGAGSFTLSIRDVTRNEVFSIAQKLKSAHRSSAEWIEEAPSGGGVLPLADFVSVTFSGAQATINGTPGPIGPAAPAPLPPQVDAITMADSAGGVKAKPGPLMDGGTSFTVTWFASNAPNSGPGHKSAIKAPMLDGQLPDLVLLAPPVVPLNFTAAQLAPATGVAKPVITTDTAPRTANLSTFPAEAISTFFAGKVAVGGMDGPAGAFGALDESPADLPWLAPLPGSDVLPAPAVVSPSEISAIRQGPGAVPTEQTAPEPYLALFECNGDPSSTPAQIPIYAAELPLDQATAAVILLGAVLSGRHQTSSTEEETKNHRRPSPTSRLMEQ
jgi:hypothetical protein